MVSFVLYTLQLVLKKVGSNTLKKKIWNIHKVCNTISVAEAHIFLYNYRIISADKSKVGLKYLKNLVYLDRERKGEFSQRELLWTLKTKFYGGSPLRKKVTYQQTLFGCKLCQLIAERWACAKIWKTSVSKKLQTQKRGYRHTAIMFIYLDVS